MHTTPVRVFHEALGARFTDFGGWEMPLQYEGVLAEHEAVRSDVGVFDVSHLGRFEVVGSGAVDLVRSMLCNDIAKVGPGRAQYTMALNRDGGVDDDIIVWVIDSDRLWVMPNGVNLEDVLDRFRAHASDATFIRPLRDQTVLLAVQGPGASDLLTEVLGASPDRFRIERGNWGGDWFVAAGTGYTGERGAEVCVSQDVGTTLMEALTSAGAAPCGLGARDTLRLEMGYPLWGQDLDRTTTPLEAGLERVVAWEHEFVGKVALEQQLERGVGKQLVAFTMEGRRPPRPGYGMRSGSSAGSVTSGNFSPTLGYGVGMGYLCPPGEAGSDLEVEMRGTWTSATVVDTPFLRR